MVVCDESECDRYLVYDDLLYMLMIFDCVYEVKEYGCMRRNVMCGCNGCELGSLCVCVLSV